jgi:hypothetical protein
MVGTMCAPEGGGGMSHCSRIVSSVAVVELLVVVPCGPSGWCGCGFGLQHRTWGIVGVQNLTTLYMCTSTHKQGCIFVADWHALENCV